MKAAYWVTVISITALAIVCVLWYKSCTAPKPEVIINASAAYDSLLSENQLLRHKYDSVVDYNLALSVSTETATEDLQKRLNRTRAELNYNIGINEQLAIEYSDHLNSEVGTGGGTDDKPVIYNGYLDELNAGQQLALLKIQIQEERSFADSIILFQRAALRSKDSSIAVLHASFNQAFRNQMAMQDKFKSVSGAYIAQSKTKDNWFTKWGKPVSAAAAGAVIGYFTRKAIE